MFLIERICIVAIFSLYLCKETWSTKIHTATSILLLQFCTSETASIFPFVWCSH